MSVITNLQFAYYMKDDERLKHLQDHQVEVVSEQFEEPRSLKMQTMYKPIIAGLRLDRWHDTYDEAYKSGVKQRSEMIEHYTKHRDVQD